MLPSTRDVLLTRLRALLPGRCMTGYAAMHGTYCFASWNYLLVPRDFHVAAYRSAQSSFRVGVVCDRRSKQIKGRDVLLEAVARSEDGSTSTTSAIDGTMGACSSTPST
jgi:hypothetical protein